MITKGSFCFRILTTFVFWPEELQKSSTLISGFVGFDADGADPELNVVSVNKISTLLIKEEVNKWRL